MKVLKAFVVVKAIIASRVTNRHTSHIVILCVTDIYAAPGGASQSCASRHDHRLPEDVTGQRPSSPRRNTVESNSRKRVAGGTLGWSSEASSLGETHDLPHIW